jgi:predicted Zn-dependent peptidase
MEKILWPYRKGEVLKKQTFIEKPITQTIKATYQDPNIQIPMVVASYRTPSMKTREARVLDFISSYLSDGSSKLYKKVVDEKKSQIGAVGFSQEDYGMYYYILPMETHTADLLNR